MGWQDAPLVGGSVTQETPSSVTHKPTDLIAKFEPIIEEAAKEHGVDPNLIHAVIRQESNGKEDSVSRAGAMGLMQIKPSTARGVDPTLSDEALMDPRTNIHTGTKYLKTLIDHFDGDVPKALSWYNNGWRGNPKYATMVMDRYNKRVGTSEAPVLEQGGVAKEAPKGAPAWSSAPLVSSTPASGPAQQTQQTKDQPEERSFLSKAGGAATRFALGAGSTFTGPFQLGANIGDKAIELQNRIFGTNIEPTVGKAINEHLAKVDEWAKEDAGGGIDWAGIAGNIFAPGGLALMKSLPLSVQTGIKGVLERAAQGTKMGAIIGAAQPTSGKGLFWEDKAAQIGAGAVTGGVVPVAADTIKTIAHVGKKAIEPLTESGRANILKRYREEELLGGDQSAKAKVIRALEQAREIVPGSKPTSAEALADVPEATGLAAHQKVLRSTKAISPDFNIRSTEQEAARRASIGSIAKTPTDMESAVVARESGTAPIREESLANANTAGRLVPELTKKVQEKSGSAVRAIQDEGRFKTLANQQENLAESGKPGWLSAKDTAAEARRAAEETGSIAGQRKSERDMAQYVLDSLGPNGLRPLKAEPITGGINAILSRPGYKASDVVSKSLGFIKDKVAGLANKDGIVDAHDLYMVRKEAGKVVRRFSEETKNFDSKLTAGLVKDVQELIDKSIEGAGGHNWRKYLSEYERLSGPINRMKVGQELEKGLTSSLGTSERGPAFANAVQNAPATLKRSTGQSRFKDLGEVLAPDEMAKVKAVGEDLSRKDAAKILASKTNLGNTGVAAEEIKPPNLLSRPAMMANYLMKIARQDANDKINRVAGQQYLHPQLLADALKDTPPSQRQKVAEAILKKARAGFSLGITTASARAAGGQ